MIDVSSPVIVSLTEAIKAAIARRWPRLHLRTIIFGTLLLVAALPGVGAIFLRVYENALVRRTEAELVAQGAALAASAALLWPAIGSAVPPPPPVASNSRYELVPTEVDLNDAPILPMRPDPQPTALTADPAAQAVADRLAPAVAETQAATLASVRLLDAQAILLNGDRPGLRLAAVDEVREALAGRTATRLRRLHPNQRDMPLDWLSRAENLRLHHARPIRVNGRVAGVILVSRSPPPLFAGMAEDWGKIAIGVVTIFLTLLFLTALLARTIVRPIERLSAATRAVAAGRSDFPGDPSLRVIEIEMLYGEFRSMADGIRRRSRYLRDFAASLSHEFKTPLAGITGGLELIEDHGETMSEAERQRFLTNMRADADRLARLTGRLMELAKADMRAPDGSARCDARAVLAQVADGYRGEGFAIDCAVAAETMVALDAETLTAIASVLIDNARQAGASNLAIYASTVANTIAIAFTDNGPGIPPADRSRIFDTFFTSKRESGGTGLGLAIARSLAESAGGGLTLEESGDGARFRLVLPNG